MSTNIIISNSLIPSSTDTPIDARTRIDSLDDISAIENPYIGLQIYNLDDEKVYIVRSLKTKLIGALTVADAQIDDYELLQADVDINLNSCLNIRIPSDEDDDNLTCYIQLSESSDFSSAITLNSSDNASIMKIAIDDVITEFTTIIPAYYGGIIMIDLTQLSNFDSSKTYYARARFNDGTSYGTWNNTRFAYCGYLEPASVGVSSSNIDISIGSNGNWYIDGVDTGMTSVGATGATGADGNDGADGDAGTLASVLTIGSNGNWYINGVDTGTQAQGETGATGSTGATGAKGDTGETGATGSVSVIYSATEPSSPTEGMIWIQP